MRCTAFLLTIMLVLSAGCATTGTSQVSQGQELLAGRQDIVSSPDQISYDLLKFEEPVKFAFDEKAAVMATGDKRRFAKGFVLPTGREPYSISITSYKIGSLTDPAILYPEVEVLDKEYRVIRTLPFNDFVFRYSRSSEGLNAVLFVNNNARGERFLLLTNRSLDEADLIASQSNITGSMPVVVPVPGVGVFMWNVPTGKNTPPIKIKASPTGQMEVLCQEYRPKKLGQ
jgi:hypothetical protein